MLFASRLEQDCRILSAAFLAFLFPPTCLSCKSPVSGDDEALCPQCLRSLKRVDPADAVFLQTCSALTTDGCLDRLAAPFYFEKGGALQDLVHDLKYHGMSRVGKLLGSEIAKELRALASRETAVIIPVPLHRTKRRERGFNQAEYLGRGIAEALGIPMLPRAVRRAVYTSSQTKLDSAQRAKNVEGVFRLGKCFDVRLRGKTILLVDDVITTGATIRSCAMTLREAKPAAIIACAAALAQ